MSMAVYRLRWGSEEVSWGYAQDRRNVAGGRGERGWVMVDVLSGEECMSLPLGRDDYENMKKCENIFVLLEDWRGG
jgi:hypothetical protein